MTSAEFFGFKNEAEILARLGNKVKALGVRKNLMRIVRKLRVLEDKIEREKIEEEKMKWSPVSKMGENSRRRRPASEARDYEFSDMPSMPTSKS